MADRYFVDAPITGLTARLVGHEAHHLAHVMRAKPGTEVTLFDGSGAEFSARVARVGRSEIELAVFDRREVEREAARAITIGVALPKGDRPRWLVEKATELGVARVVPLVTERSNQRESRAALDKLHRTVIEASKQCGRNRLLELTEPVSLAEYLAAEPASNVRLVAHPLEKVAGSISENGRLERLSEAGAASLAVGPEGGFTERELDEARQLGWQTVDLGARILRVETAALALVARLL